MTSQAGFAPFINTLGQGPRRALALHCSLAFSGAWAGVAATLGDQITMVAPDMPSHGKSPDWDEVSDFSDTVFEASLAALDDTPMDIIGHSFGAAIALRIGAKHPERVRSLTLFEPVVFCVANADAPEAMIDHDDRAADFFAFMKRGQRKEGARAFNRMWATGPTWDDLPERTKAAMTRAIHVVPDSFDFLYGDSSGLLKSGVLEAMQIPTLLMRGGLTLSAITAVNQGLLRRLSDAREVVIEGAGHMGPISHPKQVSAAIADLLART